MELGRRRHLQDILDTHDCRDPVESVNGSKQEERNATSREAVLGMKLAMLLS
jgi:hypothetical protein